MRSKFQHPTAAPCHPPRPSASSDPRSAGRPPPRRPCDESDGAVDRGRFPREMLVLRGENAGFTWQNAGFHTQNAGFT